MSPEGNSNKKKARKSQETAREPVKEDFSTITALP
jgi:hypothetical protein